MTTSALTEKTEAVLKGLVDRGERERAAGLRPAFTTPTPEAAPSAVPPATSPGTTDAQNAQPARPDVPAAIVKVQTLVEAPQTPDEVVDHLMGPEIREKFPIHLGFYLKPEHKGMIEEINLKLHRGRSAIVRRAIEHLYLNLKQRGLLGQPPGAGTPRRGGESQGRGSKQGPSAVSRKQGTTQARDSKMAQPQSQGSG